MTIDFKIAHVCFKLKLPIIKWLVLFVDAVFTLIIDMNKRPLNITKPYRNVSVLTQSK
jgi:hypothetical protein